MTIKTNILNIDYSDDMKTLAEKLNYNFRNICREANITIETNSGSGITRHNELTEESRAEPNCHPDTAITGLSEWMNEIIKRFISIEKQLEEIAKSLKDIDKTLEDHEERITALEKE